MHIVTHNCTEQNTVVRERDKKGFLKFHPPKKRSSYRKRGEIIFKIRKLLFFFFFGRTDGKNPKVAEWGEGGVGHRVLVSSENFFFLSICVRI